MNSTIHYTKPSITKLEVDYATDAVTNGWGEHCYDYIHKFEGLFKEHLGVKYAIATSSCTGALHMGLKALGIKDDDEVIIADTNWIASAAPITYLNAKPIFVDILRDTWCISAEEVEKAITPRTKAIIAVHLYGNLCEMDKLMKIGDKYGVKVVEDAAEAIGSVFQGKSAGSIGDFGTFSFHGTKTVTTGEGGMFVTNDYELYLKVLALSNHGRSGLESKQFWPDTIGYKYKMSNVQAAIGCGQMERISELISRKKEILDIYRNELMPYHDVSLNPEHLGTTIGAWMTNVVFSKKSGVTREYLQTAFRQKNIDARVFFWPLSSLPSFRKNGLVSGINSLDISSRSINLPSYHDITRDEQMRVIEVIREALD